jgi:hypothetical protein
MVVVEDAEDSDDTDRPRFLGSDFDFDKPVEDTCVDLDDADALLLVVTFSLQTGVGRSGFLGTVDAFSTIALLFAACS